MCTKYLYFLAFVVFITAVVKVEGNEKMQKQEGRVAALLNFFLFKYFASCKHLASYVPYTYIHTYKSTNKNKNVGLTAMRDLT